MQLEKKAFSYFIEGMDFSLGKRGKVSKPDWLKCRKEGKDSVFTISWNDLRETVKEALSNNGAVPFVSIHSNSSQIKSHTVDVSSWNGYTKSQLEKWVNEGFVTETLSGLNDVKPIREKRRYRYVEEGEEIHVDRALSGEDNYMSDWSKRESIPGAAIEAQVMFSASTSAEIVNAYNVWLCRAVSSLEASGIDCQLTLKFSSTDLFDGAGKGHTIVRVKRENEDLDFNSFSAILSPACLRTFGFVALVLHGEAAGKAVAGGLGRGRHTTIPTPAWNVTYNAKRSTLEIDCPYIPRDFPTGKMDSLLIQAVKEMS